MKASDLSLMATLSRPTLHPSGRRAVIAVTRPDLSADSNVGQLWTIPITGHAAPRRLTRGFRDSAPQFSPDGRLIAFLRSEPGGSAQLHIVDAMGGDPMRVTDRLLGVTEFCWSPDGSMLAFVSRVPEPGRYGTVAGLAPEAEAPRRFTTLKYRENGVGFVTDRRAQVFLIDAPDVWAAPLVQPAPTAEGAAEPVAVVPAARQLTDFDADHGAIAFSQDGATLAMVAARHARRDNDLRSNVFLLDVDSAAAPVDVTGRHGNFAVLNAPGALAYGLDGSLFFLAQNVGRSGRDFVAKNTSLFVINASSTVPRRLSDPETIDLGEGGSAITPFGEHSVLVQNRSRGTVQLLEIDLDGSVSSLSGDAPIEVTGVAAAGNTIAICYADATTTGDVGVYQNGAIRRLTDFSARLRRTGFARARELTITGRDGYPVHGWLVSPQGPGPHPVLLNIHGGPFAQYSVHFFDEAQVYADAGYAVVMCNPRGSAGYGQAHGRSIRRSMGTVDLHDVLDFLDGAIAQSNDLDGERVGIMGGSYGGYLTAWAIAHDHRFAAAIVERGFLDPDGFVGTSDIGSFFSDEYTGIDPDTVRQQSPQAMVDEVRTPTLVLHSEEDLRCPVGQAERYYASLKRRGVDTELVLFPGENHELSRSGRPRHRQQRFEVILEWWARHLPTV
ncbi:S9 family peptidase [Rathayibacter soli]|uniref:S9 family peptidase n=1 Tax=Rathayibacter soli TaxID=3144168 RepID=UPI0027E47D84|nr:S9 family peptidase [Glaciibacter superstes]